MIEENWSQTNLWPHVGNFETAFLHDDVILSPCVAVQDLENIQTMTKTKAKAKTSHTMTRIRNVCHRVVKDRVNIQASFAPSQTNPNW